MVPVLVARGGSKMANPSSVISSTPSETDRKMSPMKEMSTMKNY